MNCLDDDGSGTTTTLEVFRVLASSPSFKPQRPVEFHWYSAEELGLLGSQDIAAAYKKQGRTVYAMLQNDMDGNFIVS
jgi:leucyl aminopeptidase